MSTYVMSDIHGEYDAFMRMLAEICFSERDELYIIGDVIDRGKDGVKLLQYVMNAPNITMLLGNHEHMCMRWFSPDVEEAEKRRWNRNGNYPTLLGFDALSAEEKAAVLAYIVSLPSELKLEVGGIKYVLVHGFPGEDVCHRVWNRPRIDEKPALSENERIIIGHTPVCEYVCPGTDEDMYVYSRRLTESSDHFRIFHAEGFTDIDCCACYGMSASRLACLRLDDGAEFYQTV